MAKTKDIWMRRYTYDPSNPGLQVVKMHCDASEIIDVVLASMASGKIQSLTSRMFSSLEVIQNKSLNLFTVEIKRSRDYQHEELNALCENVVNTFNFLGLPMELYLSYAGCRRLPSNIFLNCRVTLDLNFDSELLKAKPS